MARRSSSSRSSTKTNEVSVDLRRRSTPRAVALPPSQRSTFRVAQAHRVLAEELPSVIYQRSEARKGARKPLPLSADAVPDRRAVADRPKPDRREVREEPKPLALLDDKRKCRAENRPDPARKSRGGAASRPFVPWCSKS